MIAKLCGVADVAPKTLLHVLEQILSEFSRFDAQRLLQTVLPYSRMPSPAAGAESTSLNSRRLLALRVMTTAIRFLTSEQLLQDIEAITKVATESLNSRQADVRQASVLMLVECFMSIGEALYPFVTDLTLPQRKLLTIYVQKRTEQQSNSNGSRNSAASKQATS